MKDLTKTPYQFPGARIVTYSQNFRRAVTTRFASNSPRARRWRSAVAAWAEPRGLTEDSISRALGRYWYYRNREAIEIAAWEAGIPALHAQIKLIQENSLHGKRVEERAKTRSGDKPLHAFATHHKPIESIK
jgi:hypothetical protein